MAIETARIQHDTSKELYFAERSRRETIRSGTSTPVSALAFSVFNIATLAANLDIRDPPSPFDLPIGVIAGCAIVCLAMGAYLVVRTEWGFIYLDPPDLRERILTERLATEHGDHAENVERQMLLVLAASYDLGYRRYLLENERAARRRTLSSRYLVTALVLLTLALALLPLQRAG